MKICLIAVIFFLYTAQADTEFSSIKADTNTCYRYYCKTSGQSFSKGQCGLKELSSDGRYNVYASPTCSEKEACAIGATSGDTTTYTCQSNVVTGYKWPGEKCDNSDMCNPTYSSGCKDSRCLGSGDQEECIDHNYCLPGYYCLGYNSTTKGTCQKQIETNGYDCAEDYDCVNNAWCNVTNVVTKNLCFSFGSFAEHAYVSTCSNSQNFLCSSGYCFAKEGTGHYQCSKNLTSAQPNSLPNTCDLEGQFCQSTPDEYFSANAFAEEPCACAYNQAGSLYCPLFYGDTPVIQYFTQLKKWLNSEESKKCNTIRRNSAVCIKDFWDSDNYNKLVYYNAYYEYFANIQGAESCVLKTFLTEFYEAKKAYEDSSAEILIVTALIASLF
ncbi:unnamed protein product [Blepharisma stoltei]|uniref:Dickkopf N-terminal cysteine-rich domain-containing protein n=1 Tax=Blepharisma stoltei TaxID=1481888 RepID=A0AAU9I9D3_9CILI|nr:unnamed protein product [Blepharisma stoltei]